MPSLGQAFLPLPGNLDSQNVSKKGLFLKQNGLWTGTKLRGGVGVVKLQGVSLRTPLTFQGGIRAHPLGQGVLRW